MLTVYLREKLGVNLSSSTARIEVSVEGNEQHNNNNKKVNASRQSHDNTFPLLLDMAVQNFVGDAFRGATWVALHNGGGVGW